MNRRRAIVLVAGVAMSSCRAGGGSGVVVAPPEPPAVAVPIVPAPPPVPPPSAPIALAPTAPVAPIGPDLCAGVALGAVVLPSRAAFAALGTDRPRLGEATGDRAEAEAAAEQLPHAGYPGPLVVALDDGRFLLMAPVAEDAREDELRTRLGHGILTVFDLAVWARTDDGAAIEPLGVGAIAAAFGDRVVLVAVGPDEVVPSFAGVSPAGAPAALVSLGAAVDDRLVGASAGVPVTWRRTGGDVELGCLSTAGRQRVRTAMVPLGLEPIAGGAVHDERVLLGAAASFGVVRIGMEPAEPPTMEVSVLDLGGAAPTVRRLGVATGSYVPLAINSIAYAIELMVGWGGDGLAGPVGELDLEPWSDYGDAIGRGFGSTLVDPATETL